MTVQVTDYAIMAGASYISTRADINKFPIPENWAVITNPDSYFRDPSTGFEAISFQRGNEIVISFAGTNSTDGILPPGPDNTANIGLATGVGSVQLLQAAEYYLQVQAANPGTAITFTGHSLGGGLAALMGVFFGKQAVTFDQAPFANSATPNLFPDVAETLLSDLLARGYGEAALTGLTDFLQRRAVSGGIPNSDLVNSLNVQGEFLSGVPWDLANRIGFPTYIPTNAPGVSGVDLHAQALLTAFLQSMQTAPSQRALNEVTFKLSDLLGMIFAENLYARSTGTANTTEENFLERIVRHEAGLGPALPADRMVTRFTSDLWKLAQDGGLTITDGSTAVTNFVSKALIAFAMQKYYGETQASAGYNKELFTPVTGGVYFDRADVAATLSEAKGYNLYFLQYLNSSVFTDTERQLIHDLLPVLRDWYVQAGADGMNATDMQNRGAFMLGGSGADAMTGGSQNDLLVGNADQDVLNGMGGNDVLLGGTENDTLVGGGGLDRLIGGAGIDVLEGGEENDILDGGLDNDILRGGEGLDTYIIRAIDGADTIEDSDGRGVVEFDGKVLVGGIRLAEDPQDIFKNADGTITFTKQGNDLVVTGSGPLTIKGYDSGRFGIRLFEVDTITYESILQTRTQFFRISPDGSTTPIFTALGDFYRSDGSSNDVIHALEGDDAVIGHQGNDEIYGEGGRDNLSGGDGNDQLFGGADSDVLSGSSEFADAQGGDDILDGGEGNDALFGQGGADHLIGGDGNDQLQGDDVNIQIGQVRAGSYDDFLDGGDGDDSLFGLFGDDVLLGGAGSDYLQGDDTNEDFGFSTDDYLDGGDDDDELRGGAGTDVLIGGRGKDVLIGDTPAFVGGDPTVGGADSLDGGEGDDLLYGAYGDDLLTGGADNDQLYGQDGNDALYGGEGNDTLSGDLRISAQTGAYDTTEHRGAGGNDLLDGGAGGDTLFGGEGEDILIGGAGDDQLYGSYSPGLFPGGDLAFLGLMVADGSDWIQGDAGNDWLYGGEGVDELMGGEGHDVLYGENGNDSLDGGIGNDRLDGGAGDDLLEAGEGTDQLFGGEGNDVLLSGAGDDLLDAGAGQNTLMGGTGNDTYVIYAADDQVIEGADAGIDFVESFVSYTLPDYFENLTVLGGNVGVGNALNNTISGSFLYGMGGDDVLTGARMEGGTGNDVLNGSDRSNTYVFAAGDGHDTIVEASVYPFISPDHADVIEMGAGVSPEDISWVRTGDDLVLQISGPNDQITIQSYYALTFSTGSWRFFSGLTIPSGGIINQGSSNPYYYAPGAVEIVRFADGTIWGPGQFNGVVTGSADTDTYQFGLGSGQLTIVEFDHLDGALDTIQMGVGITTSDVILEKNGIDLKVLLGNTDDVLTIYSYFSAVSGNYRFASSLRVHPNPYKIDELDFADGTVWDTVTLESQIRNFVGTSFYDPILANDLDNLIRGLDGDDWLVGRGGNDTLYGGADDDELYGDQGEDVLIGEAGDDLLFGGNNHDVYVFNLGDGIDTIEDTVAVGEGNRIQFGSGITQDDLTFTHDEMARTLTIHVDSNGTDQLVFTNFDLTGANGSLVVETLAFADGSTINLSSFFGPTITEGNDTITTGAEDDVINALGGDDIVEAGVGNDVITGGTGNDTLTGGLGNDTYTYNPGDGIDTINDISLPGDANTVEFGAGIDPTDLRLDLGSLLIRIGSTGGALHLSNFDPSNVLGPRTIETFRFADGTVLSYDQLVQRGFDLIGTDDNDSITGTNVADRITALAGDDTLAGGGGNDQLMGGGGSDTYIFNIGDGSDTIDDTVLLGGGNRIQFGVGISQNDLIFTQDQAARTLTIHVGTDGADQLVLADFDPRGTNGSLVVSALEFADGNVVNLIDLYPPNHAPTVATPLVDQTVAEGVPFTIQIPATAFTDPDTGDVLMYSASLADGTALPAWLSFDATTGTFTGMPDDAQVGSLDLKLTTTDTGNLSVSDVFTLTVANVNEGPTVIAPLANQTAWEDDAFSFTVPAATFADVDQIHGDTVLYSATQANGSALPAWLSFDSITRTFSGTPLNDDVGALDLTVTATDAGNVSASDTFTLTVQNVNDAPIVANLLPDQSAAEDSLFTFTMPSATFADMDVVHGDKLTYSATLADGNPLPSWLSFNPTTRTFVGTPSPGAAGVLQVTVTATDTKGASTTDQFALTVSGPLPQILTGTAGDDRLTGGRGDDTLSGLAGNDLLNGGEGDDVLDGGTGIDVMQGGTGNDTYTLDMPGDVAVELPDEGIDTVQSSITHTLGTNMENLTLAGMAAINGTGNALNNLLLGNSANNTLNGGAGHDRLDGGLGSDVMFGGTGDDLYVVNQAGDVVMEQAGQGSDTVESSITHNLGSNVEHLILTGSADINGMGNSAHNMLLGNSGNNILDGGSGNDMLDGGMGRDTLFGGSGHDRLFGGQGSDSLNAGSGNDLLNGGEESDMLDGGSGDDQLVGGAGNDQLTGGSGADQFTGGRGNDMLVGNSGNDLYDFSRGDGQDIILDSDPFLGNQDRAIFGATINPLDLVISRQASDLRLAIHGSTDQVTVKDWYLSGTHRVETIQAGNGEILLSTQVDQLIQAMAGFTQQTGLTWDQAIDQRPQDVQTVLAASWQ